MSTSDILIAGIVFVDTLSSHRRPSATRSQGIPAGSLSGDRH